MPSQHARELYTAMLAASEPGFDPGQCNERPRNGISVAYVAGDRAGVQAEIRAQVAVLSGPTFAREIAQGEPAAVVVASQT